MFDSSVYSARRDKLRKSMGSGIALILGNNESPMNYPANTYKWRQDSNFLYFFGIDLPGLAGIIDIDNNKDILFGNDIDIDDIIWMGPQPSLRENASRVGVSDTHNFSSLFDFVKTALEQGRTLHFLPPYRFDNMLLLQDLTGIAARETRAKASLELIKAVVALREIKEAAEIVEIEKACDIGYLMHTTAMRMGKPGALEMEIAGTIEGIALAKGGMVSFPVILSKQGETLHNHHHGHVLSAGDIMLTDAGAESELHYASDFTRVTPVGGKFSQKQREIYQAVLDANNAAIEAIKPGIKYQDVHLHSCRVLAARLKEIGLMQGNTDEAVAAGAHALFFPHGLGHMLGLDVHDMEDLGQIYVGYDEETRPIQQFGTAYLRLGKRLKSGFVLTTEPGVYFIPALIQQWKAENKFPQFINYAKVMDYIGFGGIRLEDDILVTDAGYRILGSKRVPINVEDVEEICR
jgi:Xaa-Pro aminopeptidase